MLKASDVRSEEEWVPPSEKESGVTFNIDITRVAREGDRAVSGSMVAVNGVDVDAAVSAIGKAFR